MKVKRSFILTWRNALKNFFPPFLFNFLRILYKKLSFLLEDMFSGLNYLLLFPLNLSYKKKKRYLFCFKRLGIGDALIISSVINHYKSKGKLILITNEQKVYRNMGVKEIILKNNIFSNLFISFLTLSFHSNIIGVFGDFQSTSKKSKEKKHYRFSLFAKRKDILREFKNFSPNPRIVFSETEQIKFSKKYKQIISSNYGVISAGSYFNGFPTVKNVSLFKIQQTVDKTQDKIKWIQTGTKDEPDLKNTLDLRGIPLRETFFIVKNAKIVVTTEGMLTQLAGAFDIPCVTICTGFIYPESSKYKSTFFVQPRPLPDCAYCWDHICKKTGTSIAECEKQVSSKDIISLVKKVINL